uniref:Uncharacterized protein n=1 Tax=Romanomermis culicivorax TaxID=13658 RepID=A0A915HU51_ROMCU
MNLDRNQTPNTGYCRLDGLRMLMLGKHGFFFKHGAN